MYMLLARKLQREVQKERKKERDCQRRTWKDQGQAIGYQDSTFPRRKDCPTGVRLYNLHVVIGLKHTKASRKGYSLVVDVLISY